MSNHGLVKLANSACVNVKMRFQELEEKLIGMSARTKARNKYSGSSEHSEIEGVMQVVHLGMEDFV